MKKMFFIGCLVLGMFAVQAKDSCPASGIFQLYFPSRVSVSFLDYVMRPAATGRENPTPYIIPWMGNVTKKALRQLLQGFFQICREDYSGWIAS